MGRVSSLVIVTVVLAGLVGCGEDAKVVEDTADVPAPAWLYVSAVSPNDIAIRWTDVTSDEAGFVVRRSSSLKGEYSDLATLEANTTRYSDPTVVPGATYYYSVASYDAFGARSRPAAPVFAEAVASASPLAPADPVPQTDGYDLDIPGLLTLSWTGGDPDGENVLYDIYFGESTNDLAVISADGTSTSFTLADTLANNRFYFWRVIAADPHGASALSPMWNFGSKMERVEVPAGHMFMGACSRFEGAPARFRMGDHPIYGRNPVLVDRFLIDKYEVSNQLFAQFLNGMIRQKLVRVDEGNVYSIVLDTLFAQVYPEGDQDSGIEFFETAGGDSGYFVARPGRENHPAVEISWFGAGRFARRFGVLLPTEAQWEKAARGTSSVVGDTTLGGTVVGFGTVYPWGQNRASDRMNFSDSGDPFEGGIGTATTPVGYYDGAAHGGYITGDGRSPYGALDMSGNVAEWCADDFQPYDGGTYGGMKVLKGGGWRSSAVECQTFWRQECIPDSTDNMIGFRTVKIE